MKQNIKYNLKITIVFLIAFVSTFVFFTTIHPITIISGDDWGNLSSSRSIFPVWGGFNPIKVLPENLMPLAGSISAYIVSPMGIGFLESMSLTTAIITALLVALFLVQLLMFLMKTNSDDFYLSVILVAIYYAFMFGLFKTNDNMRSSYLLWEINITCYYHYVIPALLNASLTLYLMRNEGDSLSLIALSKKGHSYKAIIFILSYFCIFSNLFSSTFLAIYCALSILNALRKSNSWLISTIRNKPIHCLILIFWFISAIFEANGGRAKQLQDSGSDIIGSITAFIDFIKHINLSFLIFLTITIISGIYFFSIRVFTVSSKKNSNLFWICLASSAVTFTAMIALCSKAGFYNAARPVVMWGVFMYIIIASLIALSHLILRYKLHYIAPFIAIVLFSQVVASNTSLLNSHNLNLSYDKALWVSQSIINQVKDADAKNLTEMTLYVPKGDDNDNWPFPIYGGKYISNALKNNGIISKEITINIEANPSINTEHGIPMN